MSGADPIRPYLDAEFAALVDDSPEPGQLRFGFGPVEPLPSACEVAPVRVAAEAFEVEHMGLHYVVRPGAVGLEVQLCSLPSPATWRGHLAPAALRRARDWNFLSPEEEIAKNFTYGMYDYMCQVSQLPLGQTWLHASSFERDGRGVALCAWGGIGKTSAMLKLALEDGWRFLSDDLALIDDGGVLWRTPKRMQIYGYNVSGQPVLEAALLDGRSALDRASWAWHLRRRGPRGVRRRVSAESLLGASRVAERAALHSIYFLERADIPDFVCDPLAVDELAERAAWILWKELQPFVDIAAALNGAGASSLLPRPQDLHEAAVEVLCKALTGITPQRVQIPSKAGPDALAQWLRVRLDTE